MRKLYLLKVDPEVVESVESDPDLSVQLSTLILQSSDEAVIEASKYGAAGSVIVLGSSLSEPIQTLQRLHTINPELSTVVLCIHTKCSDLKRSIQFTPFIGKYVRCVPIEDPAWALNEIRQEIQLAEKREKHRQVVHLANRKLIDAEHIEKRSTEYAKQVFFDRLLDSAPIGIASVDVEGRVLSWNAGAREISGQTELGMLGKPFISLFENAETQRSLSLIFARASSPIDFRTTPLVFAREPDSNREHPTEQHIEVTVASITSRFSDRGSVVLFQDVTDRVSAALERKNKELLLEEAVKSRDEFLSIASHELKTPLTPLKLHLQKLALFVNRGKFSEITPEKLSHVIEIANQQITRLAALIEDLLDVSRINAGKLSLNFEDFDLSLLSKEVINGFEAQVQALQVQLTSHLAQSLFIRADRIRIEQVLANLLTNALKFSAGNPVSVHLSRDGAFAILQIIDHGIGISEDDLNRIFLKYERSKNAQSVGGLGLGLFIGRQILDAHQGSLSVQSEIGKGSTFTVKIPAKH